MKTGRLQFHPMIVHKIKNIIFYTFVVLSLPLFGCHNLAVDKRADLKSKHVSTIEILTAHQALVLTTPVNQEFISGASVKINGKLPMITQTKALFSMIGQPDSIVAPDMNDVCTSFYDKEFKYAYLNNTQIEIYGDTAVLSSLDFRNDSELSLKTPKHSFSRNTSLASLKKDFPAAVKEQFELNVQEIGETVAVRIPTSQEPSDDSWLLLFRDGKLIRIDYYMPC